MCCSHPQLHTNILFYSAPTSVPQSLFNQLVQSHSPIQTITTFTTLYTILLIQRSIHTIAHLSTFFPFTPSCSFFCKLFWVSGLYFLTVLAFIYCFLQSTRVCLSSSGMTRSHFKSKWGLALGWPPSINSLVNRTR